MVAQVMSAHETLKDASAARQLDCWVIDQSLIQMIQYLELGFQLELYGFHEYAMIYWYKLLFLCVLGE